MSDYIKKEDETGYIKREDAHDAVMNTEPVYAMCKDGVASLAYQKTVDVIEMINAIPSADVAPVRHGHWDVREPMPIHDIKGNLLWGNWYVCTGCGFAITAIEGHITQYRYCPNCGAKMDR